MKAALDILTTAPEFDLDPGGGRLLGALPSGARGASRSSTAPARPSRSRPVSCPMRPAALAMLSEAGVPSFRTPEACADAIAAALRRRAPRPICRRAPIPRRPRRQQAAACSTNSTPARCSSVSASRARRRSCSMPTSPRAPTLPFPYPVAVKALSAEIAHKTEVGGVVLDIADGDALLGGDQADPRQCRAAPAQHARRCACWCSRWSHGVGEALVGYRVDPDVGPLVMVAAGGILTEIYRDRSLRLAPVDLATAQRDDRRGARPHARSPASRQAEGRSRRAGAGDRRAVAARRRARRSPRPRSIR